MESAAFDTATARFRQLQEIDIRLQASTFTPYALHYANKMVTLLPYIYPDATEPMFVAAQAQHLHPHFETPGLVPPGFIQSEYDFRLLDAECARQICIESGYAPDVAERVAALVRRDNIDTDQDAQKLQDLEYLVRVSDQYKRLVDENVEPDPLLLRESLKNMTEMGREFLLRIPLLERDGIPITKI